MHVRTILVVQRGHSVHDNTRKLDPRREKRGGSSLKR